MPLNCFSFYVIVVTKLYSHWGIFYFFYTLHFFKTSKNNYSFINIKVNGPKLVWNRSLYPLWLLGLGKSLSASPHPLHDAPDSMVQSSRASLSCSSSSQLPSLNPKCPDPTSNSESYASPASGLINGGSCTGVATAPRNTISEEWQGGLGRHVILSVLLVDSCIVL